MKDRLKELFSKSRYTAAEKEEIRTMAEEAGIVVNVDSRCNNCWRDIVSEIYNLLPKDEGKWFVDQWSEGIVVNGVLFCEANMDEDKAEWLRTKGLGKYLAR